MNEKTIQIPQETQNPNPQEDKKNESTPIQIETSNNQNIQENLNTPVPNQVSICKNTLNPRKENPIKNNSIPPLKTLENKIKEEIQETPKSPFSLLNGPDLSSQENLIILKNIYQNTLKKEVDIQNKNGEWIAIVEGKDIQLSALNNYITQMLQSGGNGMSIGNINKIRNQKAI
jgi:hypothetical protein